MKRAYFQYYETFEKIVQKFKTAEERENFRGKIVNYGLYGIFPQDLTEKEELVWDVIQDLIDDQVHRREVNKANREERERKKRQPEPEEIQEPDEEEPAPESTTSRENEPMTEAEAENIRLESESGVPAETIAKTHGRPVEEIKKAAKKHFEKPTVDQIAEYCRTRGNSVDPQQFHSFYESKGWKVGAAPMKDWKAAVITWEKRRTPSPPAALPAYTRQLPDDRLTF